MKKGFKICTVLILAMVLLMSLLLSSCNLFGGSKAAEEAELSVSRYMGSIESGRLARDEYESDYADDTPFAELVFKEDVASALMVDGMSKISFEIDDIEANARSNEGSCTVILTAIDIDEILKDLGETYSEEDFVAVFEAQDIPMSEYEVSLYLFYDDDEELWIIEDTSEIVDILGQPYTQIAFVSSGPQALADDFLMALSNSDFNYINTISDEIFDRADFIDAEQDIAIHLFDAVFGEMQFEMMEEYLEDDYAEYVYELTVSDFETPLREMGIDEQLMTELTMDVFYAFSLTEHDAYLQEAYEEYIAATGSMLFDVIVDSTETLEMEIVIAVEFDDYLEDWIVTWCSYDLMVFSDLMFNYDPMDYIGVEALGRIAQVVYDEMLESGRIDQHAYYRGLRFFVDEADIDIDLDTTEYDLDEITAVIDEVVWYSFYADDYVDSYDADTYILNIDVWFEQTVPGLYLYCEFYADDGATLLGADDDLMDDFYYYAEFIIIDENEQPFEPGVYSAVIYLEDGSILAESSIELG